MGCHSLFHPNSGIKPESPVLLMDSLWSEPPGKPPEHSGVGYNLFPLTSVLVVSPFIFLPVFFFISSVIFNSDGLFFKQVVMKIQKGCPVVLERGECVQT